MRKPRREFEIFNLSFLDIISCGFGAVVLLVLISNTSDQGPNHDSSEAIDLLRSIYVAEAQLDDLNKQLDATEQQLAEQRATKKMLDSTKKGIENDLAKVESTAKKVEEDVGGLELVQSSLKTASISQNTATKRDEEVGGIPVDSDYVIFIIDTSGSMKNIWDRVIRELENVLNIHPQVKGFQVMNDNGAYLISGYAGKWIRDTPGLRKSAMDTLRLWNKSSNSSPVEGLEVALKTYAKPGSSVSIYIFGDDYSGSSYDPVISAINQLNRNRVTGKSIAKIHAVGFLSANTTNRFPILMREVTRQNGGTFLALSR